MAKRNRPTTYYLLLTTYHLTTDWGRSGPRPLLFLLHSTLHLHSQAYCICLCSLPLHSIPLHSIRYTLHSMLYTLYSALYALSSILYTLYSAIYTLYYAMFSLLCTLCNICIIHALLCTLHSTLYGRDHWRPREDWAGLQHARSK